jgi:hypothetical protein
MVPLPLNFRKEEWNLRSHWKKSSPPHTWIRKKYTNTYNNQYRFLEEDVHKIPTSFAKGKSAWKRIITDCHNLASNHMTHISDQDI